MLKFNKVLLASDFDNTLVYAGRAGARRGHPADERAQPRGS